MADNRRTSYRVGQWSAGAGLAAAAAAVIGIGTAHADTSGDVSIASPDTNDALVLIPAANQEYADAANALYLAPNGFNGTAEVFITPDVGNEVQNVVPGVQDLVQTIEADYNAGDLSPTDPLYVFGYSEGAVEEGLAEQQLAAFDNGAIVPKDLNFVMVGDSASAEGGFLNTVIGSLPESLQQPTTELFDELGLTSPVLGATTPDNLYPTEVYSLTGDGWTNWDDGANTYGMFTEHLEYLGLTPAEIASATETVAGANTDGLPVTDYYSIDSANVNDLSALYNQLLLALELSPASAASAASAATTDTAAGASAIADTVTGDDAFTQATSDLTQASTLLASAPTASLDSDNLEILNAQESFVTALEPTVTQQEGLVDALPVADQANSLVVAAEQNFVQSYDGLLSAEQAFVAADQAGELSGQTTSLAGSLADLGILHAELAEIPANVGLDFATVFATFAGDLGLSF